MAGKRKRKLFEAIYAGDGRRVARLLQRGVSPNARDTDGSTALYVAAVQGEAWAVGALLSAGAAPNVVSGGETDGTPLCGAASWGHHSVLRALLEAGADPNMPEAHGSTPLLWAVRGGSYDCAVELLDAGADVGLAGADGRTPLHLAAQHGWLKLVRLLLEHGANPSAVDAEGLTPWAVAHAQLGRDVEADLRRDLLAGAPEGSVVESRHTIVVEITYPAGGTASSELECGHQEIASLLASSS